MNTYTVKYFPPELSEELMQNIRDEVHPSMESEDTSLYQTDFILENLGDIQAIKDACEGCDYLEL